MHLAASLVATEITIVRLTAGRTCVLLLCHYYFQ